MIAVALDLAKHKVFVSVFFLLLILGLSDCASKPVEVSPLHPPVVAAATAAAPLTPAIDPHDDRRTATFGIAFAKSIVHLESKAQNGANSGLLFSSVFPYQAAYRAGLRSGDVLVQFGNEVFRDLKPEFVASFTLGLKKIPLGTQAHFVVSHPNAEGKMELKTVDFPTEGRTFHFGSDPPKLPVLWPGLPSGDQTPLKIAVSKMIQESEKHLEVEKSTQELGERFKDLNILVDPLRLPGVSFLQSHPWQIQELQNLQLETLRKCRPSETATTQEKISAFWNCLPKLAATMGVKAEDVKTSGSAALSVKEDPTTPMGYLKMAESAYRESEAFMDRAFDGMSKEEHKFLKEHALEFAKRVLEGDDFFTDEDPARLTRMQREIELSQKVDREFLIRSLLPYRKLMDVKVLQELKERVGKKEGIVAELKTDRGIFLIGGTGPNDYTDYSPKNQATANDPKATETAVFILDLGGDDFYPEITANIIDLTGNDRYVATRPFTVDSGFFRSRFILDFSGDDIYESIDGGIASSLFGASLLLDLSGNDIYRSQALSIGMGWTGFSALVDYTGNDRYSSSFMSQGVGVAGGLGWLLDFRGDDEYRSAGGFPSGYGDPGQYSGFSQGVGFGLRNYISGGWGLLYDGKGCDHFEAGTFSQGGAYYFGLGTLMNDGDAKDGSDDDTYRGARYSQGFSAHYAIGDFLDVGGDDTYLNPSFVGEGMAWDLSLTLFEDRGGNDHYKTCEHCIGVASQSSFAFFIDGGGNDVYSGKDLPYREKFLERAKTFRNDYHGGKSLGLFWDRGHGRDTYTTFSNHHAETNLEWQLLKDE